MLNPIPSIRSLHAPQVDTDELSARPALPSGPRSVLQLGAFHLISCLSPGELQHLHAALGEGAGSARRSALSQLKKDYERAFKYSGKV